LVRHGLTEFKVAIGIVPIYCYTTCSCLLAESCIRDGGSWK